MTSPLPTSPDDVVVTGFGAISPAGRGATATYAGAVAGKGAAALDPQLVEAGTPVTISCRVPPFDPDEELGRGTSRRKDRYTQLALLASTASVS